MRVGVPGRDGALDRNWGERSGHEGELEKIWSLAYVVMRLRHGWHRAAVVRSRSFAPLTPRLRFVGPQAARAQRLSGLSRLGWWKSGKRWCCFPLSHNLGYGCLFDQLGCEWVLCWRTWRALALRRTSNLWATAIRTTLGGLPAVRRRCWKQMKSGS